jgi:hypothetical protein
MSLIHFGDETHAICEDECNIYKKLPWFEQPRHAKVRKMKEPIQSDPIRNLGMGGLFEEWIPH